jgi:1-acyl-sn-glycerol-3-phosphate acyltransferase
MRWLSYRVMRWLGWEIVGDLPDVPKMVIVGAPHTSNWDFFLFLGTIQHFDIKVNFLGKASLFRWPFGAMFRKVGGIPVHRATSGGLVGQVKAAFDGAEQMILVVAPEGTRKAAPHWKSGFVEIAAGAMVPVVIAGVDGAKRVLTVSPPFDANRDRSLFMDDVRAFLSDKDGLRPEGKGPVRLDGEPVTS